MAVPGPTNALVVGVLPGGPSCGVTRYADVLAAPLVAEGWSLSDHRLAMPASPAEVVRWLLALRRRLAERPDVVIWHYSVFACGSRGVPWVAPAIALLVKRSRVPTISVLHEYTYPWTADRRIVWAITHRLAASVLAGASTRLVVTTERRAREISHRWWSRRRPVTTIPVVATHDLGAATGALPPPDPDLVSCLSWAAEGQLVDVVVAGLREVVAHRPRVRLHLVGMPGATSQAADRWRRAAAAEGVLDHVEFDEGFVDDARLVAVLRHSSVLLSASPEGASSRKTTVMTAVASGRPLVAFDGPDTWRELLAAGGLTTAPTEAHRLASEVLHLLGDPSRASAQATAALLVYERRSTPEAVAAALSSQLRLAAPTPST